MKVPKIKQPHGMNMDRIRQMGLGWCLGMVGTGFQALVTQHNGAGEDIDSSAHTAPQVNGLSLGKRGKEPEFLMKGHISQ